MIRIGKRDSIQGGWLQPPDTGGLGVQGQVWVEQWGDPRPVTSGKVLQCAGLVAFLVTSSLCQGPLSPRALCPQMFVHLLFL